MYRHGKAACTPDNYGGYCNYDGKIYVSFGSTFQRIAQMMYCCRSTYDGNRDCSRSQGFIYERKMNNRIRENVKMGRDPFPTETRPLKILQHKIL